MVCPFSERFLQIIWNERLLASHPRCTDGKTLQVISTGIWNRGAGPDFHDAALLLGGVPCCGDIEIHQSSSMWFQHGHQENPAYSRVCLHLVWEDDSPHKSTGIPTLELKAQLHPGWQRLLTILQGDGYPQAREVPPGQCALRWALTHPQAIGEILDAAGWARFCRHGQELLRRCAAAGDDQSLYELTFQALGYSANRQPFQELARRLPLSRLPRPATFNTILSLLLGAAGMLPDPTLCTQVPLPELAPFIHDAWTRCWEAGITPGTLQWHPRTGRPYNSICRRIAAGAAWLVECQLRPAYWLERTLESFGNKNNANGKTRPRANGKALARALLNGTTTPPAECERWQQVRDFFSRLTPPATLLGRERRADIALNIWLPYLGAKAEINQHNEQLAVILDAWRSLPRQPENSQIKAAAHRFLAPPSRSKELLRNASCQQGIMEIYHGFCVALNHACSLCPCAAIPSTEDTYPHKIE